MNIRKLKESDWGTLQDWWNNWPDWVPPQKDFLPDNGTGGLIVEKNNTPIIAGFIYFALNSKASFFEWVIANPKYKDKDRDEAIKLLITTAEEFAKSNGKKYMCSFVGKQNPRLLKTHKELGWDLGQVTSYELTKVL